MNNPKISVICVTFNSSAFIRKCLNSLSSQSFTDFETIVIDNASTDGTAGIVEKEWPNYLSVKNPDNEGYCKAQNQGIRKASGKYILTLNPDIILDKDFLDRIYLAGESDPKIGSVSPKLFQLKDGIMTDTIDSLGHSIGKNRHIKNIGSGKTDRGQFDRTKYIFGVSGAAAFYRKEMLESIRYKDEYLDEDFFAGYDDVDIDWRSKLKGWKTIYEPGAFAWHIRSASVKKTGRMWEFLNYRNRYLVMLKNDTISGIIRHFFSIILYETGIVLNMTLKGQLVPVFSSLIKTAPLMLKKRAKNTESVLISQYFE